MADQASASTTKSNEITTGQKIRDYWVNDGPKLVFVFLYIAGNMAAFFTSFIEFRNKTVPYNYFAVYGYGVCVAKGAAGVLKLDSALILIPVLRNFLSWLRGTWVNTYIPIDKNIIFHKFIAWTIAIATALHTVAHYVNFHTLETATPAQLKSIGFPIVAPTAWSLGYLTLPGITGHVVLLIMVFMYTSAVESIRRPMFEIFWFTHHLFILFFAIICFHGAAALLGKPSFVYWVCGPLFLYFVERTMRVLRGKQTTMLLLAKQHPSKVIELRMKKQSFNYKPGQYLFLNCPYIAGNEWHPFTITSAPDEDFVSCHINIVGNWTGKLATLLNPDKKIGVVQQDLLEAPDGKPILRIDGPFGAASEEVFKYKTVMLVGAGIGVTPFASILKHIKNLISKQASSSAQAPIDKVYFYWICRDKNSFEWFSAMLSSLERDNVNNFLEINTYLTGALSPDEVRDVMYGTDEESADQITGLASPTHFGRPRWSQIFQDVGRRHANSDVGVFFCGPRVLSKTLYKNARKYTSTQAGGCRFHYNKENF